MSARRIERRFKALRDENRAGLVAFVTAGDLGALRTLENHLERTLPRERLEGFDYSGAPPTEDEAGDRRHARSVRGVGSRSVDDLSPEELEKLLGFG